MKEIFVFGSNLAGRHGAGSAKEAVRCHGASWGIAEGPHGNSYAIPTKDRQLRVLPLSDIHKSVQRFLGYARENAHLTFRVVAIGTGLAGYRHDQIAPMFEGAPVNCMLPTEWR